MTDDSLTSTLGALRHAGSVFGVLFARNGETLFSDAPYSPERLSELASIVDDIASYLDRNGRTPDQLAFSFDGGNLVLLLKEGHRLVILHHHADEVDFIAAAGRSFLKDFLFARTLESVGGGGGPTPVPKGRPEGPRAVDPTTPITPIAG